MVNVTLALSDFAQTEDFIVVLPCQWEFPRFTPALLRSNLMEHGVSSGF
jgi:hypothetical protein